MRPNIWGPWTCEFKVPINAVIVQVKPVRSQAPGILPIGISRLAAVDSSPTREG